MLRRWLREWWDNPLFRQTDPERIVPLARVPLWSWPMVRERIANEGIHVEGTEEMRYPGYGGSPVPMTSIIGRARDRDTVVRVVDEILDTDLEPPEPPDPDPGATPNGSG